MSRVEVEFRPLIPLLDVLDREVVKVQLLLESREIVCARVDGVDPEPLAFFELGHHGTQILDGYRARFEGPIPEEVCLHPRSVPEPPLGADGTT